MRSKQIGKTVKSNTTIRFAIGLIAFCLLSGSAATANARFQAKSCGLELNVTESNADGNPVLSARATATNLATKKSVKAGLLEGFPVFGELREGRYKLTVSKSGYRTTVKEVNHDCRSVDEDQNIATINVFLKKGNSKQIYSQPASRNGVTTKVSTQTTLAPDQIIANLYAEHKAGKGPFNQNKSRALVDKYFHAGLNDQIWKVTGGDAKGEDGILDFDPLYYSQDAKITGFIVSKPDAENGAVTVKFKNFGKEEQIIFGFNFTNDKVKDWRIDKITYSDGEDLWTLLEYKLNPANRAAAKYALDGDYLIGAINCSIETTKNGFWARVKCADQENFQVVDTESLTFGIFNPNETGRKGRLVFTNDKFTNGEYISEAGRKIKITRVKAKTR